MKHRLPFWELCVPQKLQQGLHKWAGVPQKQLQSLLMCNGVPQKPLSRLYMCAGFTQKQLQSFIDVHKGSTKATIQIILVRWSQWFRNSNYRVYRSALGFHKIHSTDYTCAMVFRKSNYRVYRRALGFHLSH